MATDIPAREDFAALEIAKAVLRHEARMLTILADRLDESFVDAVSLICAAKGRVIVTGLGKSGLVGRKIAATLACTGTPAFFVHSTEAHHGDAGMLLPEDVLVAISNSGETEDVVAFAQLATTRGAQVVAMCGNTASRLGQSARIVLSVGVEREADPFDLTPSASTAVVMAVGDALSVALMVVRGFTPEQFHANHPGGALGGLLAFRDDANPDSG
jgi:arabinose-5-phosphate isomerase